MKSFNQFILFLLFSLFLYSGAFAQNWITNYDSRQRSVRCFTLTYDDKDNFGTVWWPDQMDLSQPVEYNFVIYMGDKDGTGADGMAFVMHKDSRIFDAIGDKGGGLGYGRHPSQTNTLKIEPSVSIEFDTWYNKDCGTATSKEIKEDHTTVVYNGETCDPQFPPVPLKPKPPYTIQNVENDECYLYTIRWTPNNNGTQTLQMFIEGQQIFTHTDSMVAKVFNGQTKVNYGFTGSTGGSKNEQTICLLGGNTKPYAVPDSTSTMVDEPVNIFVTENDYDTDGDKLDTMNVVSLPKNGSLYFYNRDSVQYIPSPNFTGVDSFRYVVCDINSFKCYAKCDTATVKVTVNCPSFKVNATKLTDNIKCMDQFVTPSGTLIFPNNGSARAYVDTAGVQNTTDYFFNWSQNNNTYVGPLYSGMKHGNYEVYAVHKYNGCSSDTITISIDSLGHEPAVNILQNAPLTDCNFPNGELQATVLNGVTDITNDHLLYWYVGTEVYTELQAIGPVATGLEALTYTVLAINKQDGCFNNSSATVSSAIKLPTLKVSKITPVRNCKNLNDGAIEVSSTGKNTDFTFNWYKGTFVKNAGPDYAETGPVLTTLKKGFYTVTATSKATNCTSYPETAEIIDETNTQTPEVVIVSHQISCDENNPLGFATVSIGGVTSGYVFKWYKGLNQKNPPFRNGPSADRLPKGLYTVVVSGNAFACDGVSIVEVKDSLVSVDVAVPTVVPQTSCSPPNGSLTASATGASGSYDFYWFSTDPGLNPDTTAYNLKGITVNGLATQDYWVVAVDKLTRCASAPLKVFLPDNPSSFQSLINVSASDQTSCNTSKTNGFLSANVNGNTVDYDFRWFSGTFAPGTIPITSGIYPTSRPETDHNLSAGTYTVFVKSRLNGCEYPATQTILNNYQIITAAATFFDQTNCAPPNGAATITGAGGFGINPSYQFHWFDQNPGTVADTSLSVFQGSNYTGLSTGKYWAVAVDQATSCISPVVSDSVRLVVNDFSNDINILETPNASCNNNLSTGQLSANVNGITSGYTFRWFNGQFAPGVIPSGNGLYSSSQSATEPNLDNGIFTVFIKSSTSGCEYSAESIVTDVPQVITLTVNNITDQTFCNPLNGATTVSASGGFGSNPSYDFYWFNSNPGNVPDTTAADYKGSTYSGLAAADYWTIAVDKVTRCTSPVQKISIPLNITDFSADIDVAVSPNSSCLAGYYNGSMAGTVNGITAGYEFRYFSGSFAPSTVPAGTGISPAGLTSGTYTVFVKQLSTGCEFSRQVDITDAPVTLNLVTTSLTPQTWCAPPNGSATVEASGTPGAFDYYWYLQDPGTNPDTSLYDHKGSTYANLIAGDYWVIASDKITRCVSGVLKVNIADLTIDFSTSIAVDIQNQSSCIPGTFNGSLSASVNGNTNDYLFRYFAGKFASGSIPSGTGINPTQLNSGTYTVFVKDKITGCEYPKEVQIIDAPPTILLSVDAIIPQTWCDPANGEVTVSATGGNSNYFIYWYYNNPGSDPDTTLADYKGNTLSGISAAEYFIVASDAETRCLSEVASAVVPDNTTDFTNDIDINVNNNTSCLSNRPNGNLSAEVNGITTGFTFRWFEGIFAPGTIPDGSGIQPENLSQGTYTVFVKSNQTGCEYSKSIDLTDNPLQVNLDVVNVVNQTWCEPANGEATGLAAGGGNYDYYWFNTNPGSDPDSLLADFQGANYINLSSADYWVIAADRGTRCVSPVKMASIGDNTVDFSSSINFNITNNSSCIATEPNGAINANVNGSLTGFTFRYFSGTFSAGTIPAGPGISPTDLAGGTYTVFVKDNITGCEFSKEGILINDPLSVGISSSGIIEQTHCFPPNGQAEVSGSGGSGAFDYYWFNINPGNSPDSLTSNNKGSVYSGLVAADYWAIAVEKSTRCISPVELINIPDNIKDFTTDIIISPVNNTSCVTGKPNGSLTANVNGSTAGFTFRFFSGQYAPGVVPAGSGINPTGLNSGIYTIFVHETATGCEFPVESTIQNTPLTISVSPSILSHQTTCTPLNGSVTAVGGNGFGATPTYDYYWYSSNPGSNPDSTSAKFADQNYTGLRSGNYFVIAVDKITRCISPVGTAKVDPPAALPIPTINVKEYSSCDPTLPNGALTAVMPTNSDYSFRWFKGFNTNNSNRLPGSAIPTAVVYGADGEILQYLPAGSYRLRVTDKSTLCTINKDQVINNVPQAPLAIDGLTTSDLTNCSPFNGSVLVNSVNSRPSSEFDFHWFRGTTVNYSNKLTNEDGELTDLNLGAYTVIGIDKDSHCKTGPLSAEVFEANPPTIIVSDKKVIDCSTNANSMTVEVEVAGSPSLDYHFEWFVGTDLTGAVIDNDETGDNLSVGTYTVRITHKVTNCTAFDDFQITQDDIELPIVNPSAVNTTTCGGNDGALQVNIMNGHGAIAESDLYIYWFEGNSVKKNSSGTYDYYSDLRNPSNVEAGIYTVVAIRKTGTNLCPSNPASVEIADPPQPVLTQSSVNNTKCAGGDNGEIQVSASVSDNYQFDLYLNNSLIVSETSPLSNTFNDLSAGSYEVVAINLNTLCKDTISQNLIDDLAIPVITGVSQEHETWCDANGRIEVNSISTLGNLDNDYTYQWFLNDPNGAPLQSSGVEINTKELIDLSAGIYYVQTIINTTQCNSDPLEVEILDQREYPVISFSNATIQTSCDPLSVTGFTGGVEATVTQPDGTAGSYNFTWNDPGHAPVVINNLNHSVISKAKGGLHFLIAKNTITGCSDTAKFEIQEQLAIPSIKLVAKSDQSFCIGGNGSINVEASPNGVTYNYQWYNESIDIANLRSEAGNLISNLTEGTYFSVAIRQDNLCQSGPLQVPINNISTLPVVNFNGYQPQTSCDPASPIGNNGMLNADATETSGIPGNYTFTWIDPGTTPVINNSLTSSSISNAMAGNYQLQTTNNLTGCEKTSSFTIQNQFNKPEVKFVSKIDQTFCSGGNGAIEVVGNPGSSAYAYRWYRNSVDLTNLLTETNALINGIEAGSYYAIAVRDDNWCESGPLQVNIQDKSTNPVVNFANYNPQTSCEELSLVGFTGSITATASEVSGSTDSYNFDWTYPGIAPVLANTASNSVLTKAMAGKYILITENTTTGCKTSSAYTIQNQITYPDISLVQKSDQSYCVGGNGRIEVEASPNPPAYSYNWYNDTVDPVNLLTESGPLLSSLTSGKYHVIAVRADNGCQSSTLQVEIQNLATKPVLAFSGYQPQTSCDPTSIVGNTGSVSVSAKEVSSLVSTYNFTWTSPGTPSIINNPASSTISNAMAGLHRVTTRNTETGCEATSGFTILDQFIVPDINFVAKTDQTFCVGGNGSITVVAVPTPPGHSFLWYEESVDPSNLLSETNPVINGLTAGSYLAIAVRQDNLCKSIPLQVDILNKSTLPIVVFSNELPQTSCDPLSPAGFTGGITADANEVNGTPDNYTFFWNTLGQTPQYSYLPTSSSVSGGSAGKYDLRTTNNVTGCISNSSYTISEKLLKPNISLVAKSDQTYCVGGDGIIEVIASPNPPDYTYRWYAGSIDPLNLRSETNSKIESLVNGDYLAIAIRDDNWCESSPLLVSIIDRSTNPVIDLVNTIDQTSCGTPNGELEFEVKETDGNQDTYSFNWNNNFGSNNSTTLAKSNLAAAQYLVYVINERTGCAKEGIYGVKDNIILPTINLVQVIDQSNCLNPGNGSIEVVGRHLDNPGFVYEWIDFNGNISSETSPALHNISMGTYQVAAIRNDAIACKSLPLSVKVNDIHKDPIVNFTNIVAQTNCDGNTFGYNGSAKAVASELNGSTENYSFQWSSVNPVLIQSSFNESIISNASSGFHNVEVQNTISGCKVDGFVNIPESLIYPEVLYKNHLDQTYCTSGNGKIWVEGRGGANYSFEWYAENLNNQNLLINQHADSLIDLTQGNYLAVAINQVNNCKSESISIQVKQNSILPVVSMEVIQHQIALPPASPVGIVKASAAEPDNEVGLYNYQWVFEGVNFNQFSGLTESIVSNRPAGSHEVLVTNQVSGCVGRNTITISNIPAVPSIVNFEVNPMTVCYPGNGSILITAINLNDNQDEVSDYEYFWFIDEYNGNIAEADYINDGSTTGLPNGVYTVIAREKTLMVISDPLEVVVADNSTPPMISLEDRVAQTNCNPDPSRHNGKLNVAVNSSTNPSGYAFNWYQGDTTNQLFTSTSNVIEGLSSDLYWVKVTEETTGCSNFESFYIPERILPIIINTSVIPNVNCIQPNGSIAATLVNHENEDYDFYWFESNKDIDFNNPSYEGQSIGSLKGDVYTLVAVSKEDNFCKSSPSEIEVPDYLTYPEAEIILESPLTNCDPAIANGQLAVNMNANYSFFSFNWYVQSNPEEIISNQPVATDLSSGTYTLVISHNLTGCSSTFTPLAIPDESVRVPQPQVTILSELTNCEFFNGAATASVNGNTNNYYFQWQNNDQLPFTPLINHVLDSLNFGNYQVVARDLKTGCLSDPVGFAIADETVYPDFDLQLFDAICNKSDGKALVLVKTLNLINNINWYTENGTFIHQGDDLTEIAAGIYNVEAVGDNLCKTTKSFKINSEINIFNGISANEDGNNDWFILDCIESYPDNNVKIFNRSGTLVYETDHYDNLTNRFYGIGNRGIYLGSKELPAGTYFYVIDLNDGSRPRSGYLELVR